MTRTWDAPLAPGVVGTLVIGSVVAVCIVRSMLAAGGEAMILA
jgi:hypothetical protein